MVEQILQEKDYEELWQGLRGACFGGKVHKEFSVLLIIYSIPSLKVEHKCGFILTFFFIGTITGFLKVCV